MKIAVTGCGLIAESHLRILRDLHADAEIILCDLDNERAQALAHKWSIQQTYNDFADLLSVEKPDTVHITTPPPTHASLAEEAIRAGCHVFVEKPVAETGKDFKRLLDLAEEKQAVLYPGYSTLGMPVVVKLKQEIAAGRFGRLISAHCNYGCSWPNNQMPYADPGHWAYRLRGGVLQNMADHPASLILDLIVPVKQHRVLFSSRNILPLDCPDLLHVAVENDDQIGSFTLSLGHGSADRRAHLLFEQGSVVLDMGRMLVCNTTGRGPHNFAKKAFSGLAEGWQLITGTFDNAWQTARGRLRKEPGIRNLVADFYACISHDSPRLVRNETVAAVTALLDSVWGKMNLQPPQNGNVTVAPPAEFDEQQPPG